MSLKITHNLVVKIISIILAVGLWVVVDANKSKISNYPGKIPIEYKGLKNNLAAINDVQQVGIKIFTDKNIWQQLSSSTFIARVDLTGLEEGVYELPINVTSSTLGVQIVETSPANVMVRIEPSSSKIVPVTIKPEGDLAKGKSISSSEANPEKVSINGAKSIIDNISEAVVQVNVKNQSESISVASDLMAFDNKGNVIKSITFDPLRINVKISIEDESTIKNVGVTLITTGEIASGYQVEKINLSPSVISIRGNAATLKNISNISTREVNLSDFTQSKTVDVLLDLPQGVLLKDNINKIKVSLDLIEININKEFSIPINISKVPANYTISRINSTMAQVILSGPLKSINNLNVSEITAKIDGSGLSIGGNKISLNTGQIQGLDQRIKAISISPETISIDVVQ